MSSVGFPSLAVVEIVPSEGHILEERLDSSLGINFTRHGNVDCGASICHMGKTYDLVAQNVVCGVVV